MRDFDVAVDCTVRVRINDPSVIERVTGPQGYEWRGWMYPLHTEQDVLAHIAESAITLGYRTVNKLDGWADLPSDAGTMEIVYAGLSYITEPAA